MSLRATVTHKGKGARILADFDRRLEQGIAAGLQASVTDGRNVMLPLVSGGVSSAQLAREHHPFGRGPTTPQGIPRGIRPLLPINVQTGDLRASFFAAFSAAGGLRTWQLGFSAPESAFVLRPGGTALMRARGYFPQVTRQLWPRFRRNLERSIRLALS